MVALKMLIFLGFISVLCAETTSQFETVKEHLKKSAEQLSLSIFLEPPDAHSYLNHDLTRNNPHKMNLSAEITKVIRDWSPRLLALDPTSPYYFSADNDGSDPEEDRNLLSYLQAIETNRTLKHPFRNIFPQSYRHALPLFSILQCQEHVHGLPKPFFENLELLVGPGHTQLAFERKSDDFSQLYCSLYGWPNFLLIDTSKNANKDFDAEQLLNEKNLAQTGFILTTVAPGSCLYTPAGWTVGAHLNNSISLIYTLSKITAPETVDAELLPCTATNESTVDDIEFTITDSFNATEIGLIIYFYQYLNPPIFDQQFTSEAFLDRFREDKNVSQLVITWTPDLKKLINNTLFKSLDINHDGMFNADDYFTVKKSNLKQIQQSIYEVLEYIRQTVLSQYTEVSSAINTLTEQIGNLKTAENPRQVMETLMDKLPEAVKEKLREKNIDVKKLLEQVETTNPRAQRPKADASKQREDDSKLLFDQNSDESKQTASNDSSQEEEIIAEPLRTEL